MKTFKKIFDNSNPNWENDPKFNKAFLQELYHHINLVFGGLGFVLLRDLYGILAIPITMEACIYGWHKDSLRDENFVKFRFSQIGETSDFELIFECYPILGYLPSEGSEA